jgi:hypothetical protein
MLMVCPSRGGPHKLEALLAAWRENTKGAVLLVICDPDDPRLPEYRALHAGPGGFTLHVQDEPRRICAALNAVVPPLAPGYDVIGYMADSHVPRTPGWDEALAAALATPGVSYPDDMFQGENLPTCMAMTAKIIEILGYLAPPGVEHLYFDDFCKQAGADLGHLAYLPEVKVEHVHPAAGKAPWDEQWERDNSGAQFGRDQAAYQLFLAEQWPAGLARLREGLGL